MAFLGEIDLEGGQRHSLQLFAPCSELVHLILVAPEAHGFIDACLSAPVFLEPDLPQRQLDLSAFMLWFSARVRGIQKPATLLDQDLWVLEGAHYSRPDSPFQRLSVAPGEHFLPADDDVFWVGLESPGSLRTFLRTRIGPIKGFRCTENSLNVAIKIRS